MNILSQYGQGVYTILVWAYEDGEAVLVSEYSLFHLVAPPDVYTPWPCGPVCLGKEGGLVPLVGLTQTDVGTPTFRDRFGVGANSITKASTRFAGFSTTKLAL